MKKNRTILDSFKNAFSGLGTMIKEERNIKIEMSLGILALFLCRFFSVSKAELLAVLICCMVILPLECINTALEQVIDLVSPEYHDLAKRGKDFAAGAVAFSALFSAFVGMIIFAPYIISYFKF